MRKAKRILVVTLSFGSGHVQAARTIARELVRREPGAEVRVIDALSGCSSLFRAGYVWPYWLMVRYAPALWESFFIRRVARMKKSTAPEWAFRWGCSHVFEEIAGFNPDVIVAAEVAACEMAVMAKRERLTTARIINVITDYEAEPVWVKPEVDVYAVADEHVREQLCAWGAPRERIVTCGIPTDPAFQVQHSRRATRVCHGFDDDAPIVLLMGGGMGPTRMHEVAAHLCESGEEMNILAVAGHDVRSLRRLNGLRARPPVSLRVLGWTEDVAALMQASSLVVTKPGGLTVAEALSCSQPLVMFDPIPGPELRNARRVAEAGAGLLTTSRTETALVVLSLLRDEGLRIRMATCARALAQPKAIDMIVSSIINEPSLAGEDLARRMTA
ncbi:MAG TPA: glycosyltransferase [Pyrinomonadaceae bacterium]|nr:glycosyltransferase [Pyrinomonadaceae bacterium]